jgi:hypothetical protein
MSNESDSEQIVLQESESYPHILPGMKLKKPSKFKLHFLEIKAAYLLVDSESFPKTSTKRLVKVT